MFFSIIQNWPPKPFYYITFQQPGFKYTLSSNRLNTVEKSIIVSSVTKNVYIRACISLISTKGSLYVLSLIYLPLLWWLKRFHVMKWEFSGIWNPYNLSEYFQNKEIDWNKTLGTLVYKWIYQQQTFLNTGSNELHSSHRKKEQGTSMWNAWVRWVFVLLHAYNFIMKLNITAYRGNSTIPASSKLDLFFQYVWLPDIILSQRASS